MQEPKISVRHLIDEDTFFKIWDKLPKYNWWEIQPFNINTHGYSLKEILFNLRQEVELKFLYKYNYRPNLAYTEFYKTQFFNEQTKTTIDYIAQNKKGYVKMVFDVTSGAGTHSFVLTAFIFKQDLSFEWKAQGEFKPL